LEAADRALEAGYSIAGFFSYEFGASCAGVAERTSEDPLLTLGVYDAPQTITLPEPPASSAMTPPVPRVSRSQYDSSVSAIRDAIRDGEVYQVNYTLPFDFAFAGEALDLYTRLAGASEARYCAYVEDGDRALLSFSPELFLGFGGGRVATKPMKGTALPGDDEALSSAKNRAEHVMIVDLLRNDLHRICSDVTVDELFTIERYPTFSTMTSTISGALEPGTSLARIFRAAFPCGSVTGAPKRAAMQYIAAIETEPRGAYTGSIGYLTPQRSGWWNVAIRTMQVDRGRGRGRFDAGGGIVSDSNAEDEWREVMLKTAFLRSATGSFACLETLRCGPGASDAQAHLSRLEKTARHFGIAFDREALRARIEELNAAREPQIVRIRVTTRGVDVLTEPLAAPDTVALCLAEARVDSSDPLLRYKTSWRPAHDAAAESARKVGCFDALLQNERGELTEGSRTNLFVRLNGKLYTPPLECGVLPGVLRARLLAGGECAERAIHVNDLHDAEEIFAGNSARGLLKAQFVEERDRV
jgi:para-aminobenzoate synthetase/4-amino-4-deoxychorismate lyase